MPGLRRKFDSAQVKPKPLTYDQIVALATWSSAAAKAIRLTSISLSEQKTAMAEFKQGSIGPDLYDPDDPIGEDEATAAAVRVVVVLSAGSRARWPPSCRSRHTAPGCT